MTEILLLGSNKSQTSGIASLLRQDCHIVHTVRDVERWREAEAAHEMDLIVAALGPSEQLFATGIKKARGFPTPILVIQQGAQRPLAAPRDERLVDRIASPFTAEDLVARVDALIRVKRAVRHARATACGDEATAGRRVESVSCLRSFGNRIGSILGSRVPRFSRPPAPYVGVAGRVAHWADRRDAFEPGHAERVAAFSALIADGIGLSEDETTTTVHAARLHDIGKIALPIEILRQPGPLAEDQKRLVRTHPAQGAMILDALNADASIVDAIRYHHARYDGKGSERNGRRDTPRPARIVAVAEVYDAMTSSMLVPALKQDAALERIRGLRGGQLDPDCVDALLDALKPRPGKIRVAPRVA